MFAVSLIRIGFRLGFRLGLGSLFSLDCLVDFNPVYWDFPRSLNTQTHFVSTYVNNSDFYVITYDY